MITSTRAATFAAVWSIRPEHAKDEKTLANMLARLLQDVAVEAPQLERERIQKKLTELIR
jgi:hypothetical protein